MSVGEREYSVGVTKYYFPVLTEEKVLLKNTQACVTGLEWLKCCWRQVKSAVMPSTEKKSEASYNFSEVTFDQYELQLLCSHGLPATQDHLITEFKILFQFASQLLKRGTTSLTLQTWWTLFHSTIERAFATVLGDKPALGEPSIENSISMTTTILCKSKHLNRECPLLCKHLICVCCSACWLLLFQKDTKKAKTLSLSLVSFQNSKPASSEKDQLETLSNIIYMTAMCSSLQNTNECLTYVKKMGSSFCHHTLAYFTAYLLYDSGQIEEALHILSGFTSDNVRKEISRQLLSRVSCLVGTCMYKLRKYNLSIDWYAKAISEDPSCLVPLWHLANSYRSLRKPEAERQTLHLLIQASLSEESTKSNAGSPSIASSESQYILASRLNNSGFYEESSEQFNRFLQEYNPHESRDWILVAKPSLSQIHVEAALACLNAGTFQECISLTETVLLSCADTNRELERGLYRKVTDILDLCEETFSQKYGPDTDRRNVLSTQSTSCYALLLQAVALMHLGKEEESAQVLRRILSSVSLLDLSADRKSHETKKSKMDENGAPDKDDLEEYLKDWQELVSRVYGSMAYLRLKKDLKVDALHWLRVSLMAWPDNLDSVYNYVLVLLHLGERKEASSAWRASEERGLKSVLENEQCSLWTFNVSQDQLKRMDTMVTQDG